MHLHGLLRRWLYFLYIDDVRTSQETHLCTYTASYGDGFTLYIYIYIYIYIYDVRTSQETHL
jgi:hypothetical protein